ncbi:arginine--tRNA ligase [Membranihabitans marinus]|uniref:arginine--tRNA ligase n=1 Tax=Membranihabitans marinus TaxID=1227546 RepID=UPI001F0090C9|nr:arginine--tRNA ligase [Membranihabitans marinus]
MWVREILEKEILQTLVQLYQLDGDNISPTLNVTRTEFEGEYTLVLFPLIPKVRKKPEVMGGEIGDELVNKGIIQSYNVVKGFLNLTLNPQLWTEFIQYVCQTEGYGSAPANGEKVIVEFSSPNTNKPLHLGHIRNILLGWSTYSILKERGYEVIRTQIINDRGIAICKSMLAWQLWGEGKSPADSGVKGDHFVGDFYVLFEQKFQEEYKAWQESDEGKAVYSKDKKEGEEAEGFYKRIKNIYFNQYSVLGRAAKDMLLRWEANDEETISLWKQMNGWVYEGFESTYEELGVSFDKVYYESSTYLYGKEIVQIGEDSGQFYRKEDGSVWVDLTDAGMDEKILLRSDGTSVYITQDLGTAHMRYKDYQAHRMIYVVADEQNYHFDVLFQISKILKEPYAEGMYHLSYGMVDLPSGKMKSREGTVVDADDLMQEVKQEAKNIATDKGEIGTLPVEEQEEIFGKIGLGALKFHMIKVQPKKRMIFDPKESVDMQGQTGPYIQNAFVRIKSIIRKMDEVSDNGLNVDYLPFSLEKELLVLLSEYPIELNKAAQEYDPSIVANFAYKLAKTYHRFYNEHRILSAESEDAKLFRLELSKGVAQVLERSMKLLGIEMPDKM